MTHSIGTALLGYGLSGRVFHMPFLNGMTEFDVRMVWARRPELIADELAPYGVAVTGDLEAVLADPAIELVVVTVPNELHFEWTMRALEAGKHVVLEKPMTITAQDADRLIVEAEKRGRVLTVYHNRRWDSDFLTVRKLVNEGALGRLVEFESHFDRFRPQIKNAWREKDAPGSGVLYDLGSHLIDQAVTLFGIPESLFADLRVQRTGGATTDAFEMLLLYPGLKVTLKSGSLVREPLPRFIALGERGSFVKYGLDVQEAALKEGLRPEANPRWGVEPDALWGHLHTEVAGSIIRGRVESEAGNYGAFYSQLARAVRSGDAPPVTAKDGRNVIRLIELAQESHAEGRVIPVAGRL